MSRSYSSPHFTFSILKGCCLGENFSNGKHILAHSLLIFSVLCNVFHKSLSSMGTLSLSFSFTLCLPHHRQFHLQRPFWKILPQSLAFYLRPISYQAFDAVWDEQMPNERSSKAAFKPLPLLALVRNKHGFLWNKMKFPSGIIIIYVTFQLLSLMSFSSVS